MHRQTRRQLGGEAAASGRALPLADSRPRKRDAEIVRDEINRRIALGALYPSEPQTFAEFVEGWLERYAQRVRPATLASCRDSLRRLAVFDGWLLETIRAADVEDHVFAIAQRAPRAAELMLDTLKMILRNAKERGQMIDEAILRVRPPRRERTEMRFLDWAEVEQLASETIEPYGNPRPLRQPHRPPPGRAVRSPRPGARPRAANGGRRGGSARGQASADEDECRTPAGSPFGGGAPRPPRAARRPRAERARARLPHSKRKRLA